ncbi:pOTRA domain protein FtsQ-type [Clostridium sp. CAG:921]|nr:pOTRA domain protein FtsQ-type [Clostridium sp. CAG:921]
MKKVQNSRTSTKKNSIKDNSKNKQDSFNYDKKRHESKLSTPKQKNKNSFSIVVTFFLVALLIAIVITVFFHPVFNLKDVEIVGTNRYTSDQVVSSSNLKLNENIFVQVLKNGNIDLSKLPYIKSYKYEYKLPDKIVVSVIERTPLYIAYNKDVNKYYLIDGEGYILEESKPEKTSEEQVFVYGIVFSEDFDVGDKINDIDKSKLDMFLNIKNELKNVIASASVTKVSFENALTIITLNDKLNVVFSDDKNLKYVIAFLSEIINNVGIDSIGTIDMTKKNPTFSAY